MLIIGCDYHPGFQQVAIFDKQTGEIRQRRLAHPQEAMEFYRGLPAGVLVGIESTGFSGWFERLLETLGHEVWMGDATQIRASMTRKQKTDKRDAEHMVKLLVEERFPRIWVPSAEDPGCAAVAGASSQAGAVANPGQESVAVSGPESGAAAEVATVDAQRTAEVIAFSWIV